MTVQTVALPLSAEFDLPSHHPLAPRSAWQCVTCNAIFYPEVAPPAECPVCNEADE